MTISYDGNSVATGQVDVGGRSEKTACRLRVNAVAGDGETFANSNLNRKMISLAGDVRPFERTVVEAFYSRYDLVQRGFPGWFTYGRTNTRSAFVLVPADAPDPAARDRAAWAGVDLKSRIAQGE